MLEEKVHVGSEAHRVLAPRSGTLRAEFTAAHNELRTELTTAHNELRTELRTELTAAHNELRTELRSEFDELRAQVADNGQRLARIEGFLGIGVPDPPPE